MLRIASVNNINTQSFKPTKGVNSNASYTGSNYIANNFAKVSSENLKAYVPSFTAVNKANSGDFPSEKAQEKAIKEKLDAQGKEIFDRLKSIGMLNDDSSNDKTTVLNNLYKIATEPRIIGLSDSQILKEVLQTLDNPFCITQKFGDIPNTVADQIEQETGKRLPDESLNVESCSCVATSIEFNMACQMPAEFVRFAQGLSGADYSVKKNIKMSDISMGTAEGLHMLRTFNAESEIDTNWEDVTINVKPDRNAIIRARVQSSFRDPGERSCIDVLIQSALLNLGSQHTYDAITDVRETSEYNDDTRGLTDIEKTFVEEVIFEQPKFSVTYQNLDENGYLVGYDRTPEETMQHILKSLELGQNVIIGYTFFNAENQVEGGHEITIVGYQQDKDGHGYFICNDTDDDSDEPIIKNAEELLPLIHHAGIPKGALGENDVIAESWKIKLAEFKADLENNQNNVA